MPKLLELCPEQIERETVRSLEIIADERARRRSTALLVLVAIAFWAAGLGLIGLAGHVQRVEVGGILLGLGLVIGNAGPMYIGLWYWQRMNSRPPDAG